MTEMLWSTVASTLFVCHFLLSGFLIARRLFRDGEEQPAEYWLPVCYMLGLAFHGVVQMAALAITGTVSDGMYGAALVLLLAANLVPVGKVAPLAVFGGFSILKEPANPRMKFVYWLLAGWLLLHLSIIFFNGIGYPQLSYDGRAIWNLKAKILFEEREILGEVFLDRLRVHYHADYPILVPLTQSTLFRLLDTTEFPAWRLIYSSNLLFLVLFVYQGIARAGSRAGVANSEWRMANGQATTSAGSRTVGLVVALLLASIPFRELWVSYHGGVVNAGEADWSLAFFALVTFYSAFQWWQTERREHLILASIGCAAALMTKKEGVIILALLCCIQGFEWIVSGDKRRRIVPIIFGVLLAVALALPWFKLGGQLPNHYDEDFSSMISGEFLRTMWRRLPAIGWMFQYEATDWDKFGVLWLLFPAFVLVNGISGRYRNRAVRFFDVLILGWMTAYVIVYCLSPLNLRFHLATSMHRLLLHMQPIIMMNVGMQGILLGAALLTQRKIARENA